jgi:hypothetical protein
LKFEVLTRGRAPLILGQANLGVQRSRVNYLLEFYHHPPEGGGNRIQLTFEKRRLKSTDSARVYALGAMENVLFDGKEAHSCCIKDQTGALICEVKRDAGN